MLRWRRVWRCWGAGAGEGDGDADAADVGDGATDGSDLTPGDDAAAVPAPPEALAALGSGVMGDG